MMSYLVASDVDGPKMVCIHHHHAISHASFLNPKAKFTKPNHKINGDSAKQFPRATTAEEQEVFETLYFNDGAVVIAR